MANYHTPIVVQQAIPAIDLTALERLLLAEIFDMQVDDDALYLSSDEGVSDMLYLDADKLRPCLDDPVAEGTTAWAQIIDQCGVAVLGDGEIEIDASGGWWENILQDVVRRSETLGRVDKRDSHLSRFLIHMWTPPWQGHFVGTCLIGCFHMSGLFVRHSYCRWP